MPERDYQDLQIKICNAMYRVCRGPLFYSHKNRIVNGRLISPLEWLPKTRWTVHQSVVLNKGSGANVDKRRFFPVHELIYVCLPTPDYHISNNDCLTDVWPVEQTNRKDAGHPAVMPLSAAKKCVIASNAKTVLDPFMGSGTTGVACARLGRKFIGIEIDQKYFELACRRIKDAYRQPDMLVEMEQSQ